MYNEVMIIRKAEIKDLKIIQNLNNQLFQNFKEVMLWKRKLRLC
jgi:hypothetical protein